MGEKFWIIIFRIRRRRTIGFRVPSDRRRATQRWRMAGASRACDPGGGRLPDIEELGFADVCRGHPGNSETYSERFESGAEATASAFERAAINLNRRERREYGRAEGICKHFAAGRD